MSEVQHLRELHMNSYSCSNRKGIFYVKYIIRIAKDLKNSDTHIWCPYPRHLKRLLIKQQLLICIPRVQCNNSLVPANAHQNYHVREVNYRFQFAVTLQALDTVD